MAKIELTQNKFALVDTEDFEKLKGYKWYLMGSYAARYNPLNGGNIFLHREIMGTPSEMETDHINGDRLDNRRINLRVCTSLENHRNRLKGNKTSSKYKGVTWHKRCSKWYAAISLESRSLYIGYFKNEVHAAMAYDLWADYLFGSFAKLNFKKI